MNRLHIIGGKNHGKTTLISELVRAMRARNLCIGTIKHTHHHHELDTPGKDSYRHREAGADVVGICSPTLNAVFWPSKNASDGADKYADYGSFYDECDIVLVEGNSQTTAPKVEVWRSCNATNPLALADRAISAVITDDATPDRLDAEVLSRSDITALVTRLLFFANVVA